MLLRKNEHFRFYILIAFLSLVLFLRYAVRIDIPRIVLTGTVAMIAILGTRNEILAIVMCCIPLHEAVDLFYSVAICAIAFIIKNPKQIHIDHTVLVLFSMIVWELLHCFVGSFSVMQFLVTIIPLVMIFIIMCIDVRDIDYSFVSRTMAASVVIMCIVLLGNLLVTSNFNFISVISGLRRLGVVSEDEKLLGGAINPNTLGIMTVISMTSLLQLRTIGEIRKSDTFLLITLLIFGVLTSSRTFLVCLMIMVVLLILGQQGTVKSKVRFLVTLIVLASVALVFLNLFFPELLKYYIGRFSEKDITTGRDVLMQVYHQYITENPKVMFWGIGLQDYVIKLTDIYRVAKNSPHNSIQEIVIAWGIPGLLMFIGVIIIMIIKSRKYCARHTILNYIPLLIILAKSMVGQMLTSPYTMLALAFAYLSLTQNFQSMQKNVSEISS